MVRAVVKVPKRAINEMPVVAESNFARGAAGKRRSLCLCRNPRSSDEDRADNGSGERKRAHEVSISVGRRLHKKPFDLLWNCGLG
jgi:hypothetical protein